MEYVNKVNRRKSKRSHGALIVIVYSGHAVLWWSQDGTDFRDRAAVCVMSRDIRREGEGLGGRLEMKTPATTEAMAITAANDHATFQKGI